LNTGIYYVKQMWLMIRDSTTKWLSCSISICTNVAFRVDVTQLH